MPSQARPTTVHAASEGDKFSADHELVAVDCPTCHIRYAIPASLERSARRYPGDQANGWRLSCPLGHTWWFVGESEEDRLRRALKVERREAGRLAAERDQARATARAQKARATRFRNDRDRERGRVAAGVCPCCNRTFANLARHMKGQHPGFGGSPPSEG
ncbi:hypothetical protein [Miltoncostaea marina]|uniref:hypothetical protein n=1 Tax=Miltoncostaea marina TaxID=2843215 RepID=UPI001C3DAF3D|nr:hypothetical protein [Miltoncostaea marina]